MESQKKKILPTYSVIDKIGPDHDPVFKIRVFISDDFTATAKGKNKQNAEIKAAQILLKKLNNE